MAADDKEFDEHLVRFRKLPLPVRVVYARPRTFIAIAVGIVAFFLLPGSLRLVTRLVDRLGCLRRAVSRARLHHDAALRRRPYPPQRGAAGRRPLPDPAGDRARRLRQPRRDRVRTRRLEGQPGRADPGDRDDRAVMGGGAHRLRAALRARISIAATSPAACSFRAATRTTRPTTGTSSTSRS